ncbi:MAG: bifunctional UDP-N-acetylglucosamine diphosphorylase/glucosamine-1-phosphate N-acetyltransferase GlmU [Candidatus Rokubacteria bacterium]|nr:bifunctional UDP-N-acetylglucosamine diphosphorylase/glucosamine-1-phosphate N-acetyltransferase GlmU [Candidatus Rokubacteria bacterium]MBI2491023.1 bifunctional UDP-N-acetylglucosamine diphosphorylase/glucosamine-1-phosphate N-acetyltransferase GlmU [Candidatus Rokubacteria bacterium]MBI4629722.1 bifunctional UDP-N-acetylglucosamine diphosphorylase/glucosamine-1-phosphate N-acetyltransferase GlmU [Candidatus Rokubacteria bacterium]
MDRLTVVILAAGEGKRMRSRQPKVLHPLCGRPLIGYSLRTARALADRIVLVVGAHAAGVRAAAGDGVTIVEQRERLGTGHAVLQARAACGGGTILVLPADAPLLSGETLERLVQHHQATGAVATVLTAVVDRPQGYGRILRQGGRVKRIVEDRDATDDQKKIREINTSVYCFEARRLWKALAEVKPDNDQGEYYLTDVIGVLAKAGGRLEALATPDPVEALGINDRKQLAAVAALQRRRILDRLMAAGVTILDPASTWVEDTVTIGPDTTIYPQVLIEGPTTIGSDCVIAAGCQVSASRLGDGVTLKPYCVLGEAVVEDGATLGPFCHLRPLSHVGPRAKVGNFVELKKSRIGRGAKVPHLSYVGDATVGEDANVGAGTITCNYDGVAKHETRIGDRAFIGTNTSLVAPLTIGEGAYIGAGSTITKDVPAGALAVGRGHQVVREGWAANRAAKRPPVGGAGGRAAAAPPQPDDD